MPRTYFLDDLIVLGKTGEPDFVGESKSIVKLSEKVYLSNKPREQYLRRISHKTVSVYCPQPCIMCHTVANSQSLYHIRGNKHELQDERVSVR